MYLPGDYSGVQKCFVDGLLPVLALLISQVPQFGDVIENSVGSHHSESYIDAEQSAALLHDHPGVEARPYLDAVGIESMSLGRIEHLRTNLLKPQTSHHRVEEDLQEVEVVLVGGLHELDPLDHDLVLRTVVLGLERRNVADLAQTVQVGSPIDVEFELCPDLILHLLENCLPQWSRVLRNFWIKFDGVLVDTLDLLLVEFQLVVVGEELDLLTSGLRISLRSGGKQRHVLIGLHLLSWLMLVETCLGVKSDFLKEF